MKFCDYEFIHVGKFVRTKKPLKVKFDGKQDQVTVELEFVNERVKEISESVYLVTVNSEVKYVGEYSKTLGDRWLKREKDNYIWHSQDISISDELRNEHKVLLYLIKNPFISHSNGHELNISKSIEHDILQRTPARHELWNKRNRLLNRSHTIRVEDIL
jgi:hypothetical protein